MPAQMSQQQRSEFRDTGPAGRRPPPFRPAHCAPHITPPSLHMHFRISVLWVRWVAHLTSLDNSNSVSWFPFPGEGPYLLRSVTSFPFPLIVLNSNQTPLLQASPFHLNNLIFFSLLLCVIKAESPKAASDVQSNILSSLYRDAENQCGTKIAPVNACEPGSAWPNLVCAPQRRRGWGRGKRSVITNVCADLLLPTEPCLYPFQDYSDKSQDARNTGKHETCTCFNEWTSAWPLMNRQVSDLSHSDANQGTRVLECGCQHSCQCKPGGVNEP